MPLQEVLRLPEGNLIRCCPADEVPSRPPDAHSHKHAWELSHVLLPKGSPAVRRPYATREESEAGMTSNARDLLQALQQKKARARDLQLHGTDLAGAQLDGLHGDNLELGQASLRGASLRGARLTACSLERAVLDEAVLEGAALRQCRLDGAHLARAHLAGARLEDSFARGTDLSQADLRKARLSETSFARAILREAILDGAEGVGVELRGADLTGASLVDARLDEADFRGADLTGANLSGGSFRHADFRGAVLDGVQWTGSDRTGARFDAEDSPLPPSSESSAPPTPPEHFDATALATWLGSVMEHAVRTAPGTTHGDSKRGPETPAELLQLLGSIQQDLGARGVELPDLTSRLQPLLSALEQGGDEPPEEWKAWLDAARESSAEELVRALLARLQMPR
ncbi:pentapeptide repeat-containing protein [Corallococcus macrosporus]|nr:pentapeptide repeat-containing protein [Corallococcus macrosporus]